MPDFKQALGKHAFGREALIIRIALCDDEGAQLAQAEAFLRTYRARRPHMELDTAAFSSGIDLMEHLRAKGAFDLYLLDVIMPGENGIELGRSIREFDQGGRIVYLTASRDFAVDSYQVRAWDYLLKPLDEERLFQILDGAAGDLARDRRALVSVKTRDGFRRLPFRSVVYGELADRCVRYHLSDNSVLESTSLRGSFRDAVRPLLEQPGFVLCAASFIVNLLFVERVEPSGLRLTDGRPLPLSRLFRAEVTERWLDYYLKGGPARESAVSESD